MMHEVVQEVLNRIKMADLPIPEAARQIGVTTQSLRRHLNGEYARSDSIAKYRLWLSGVYSEAPGAQLDLTSVADEPTEDMDDEARLASTVLVNDPGGPSHPFPLVDLFCGCGGLSLGFELLGGGGRFRTVLALDNEEPMVRVFNRNHRDGSSRIPVGRQIDLLDFFNECEILAFYLDHLASRRQDKSLRQELDRLNPAGICDLKASLHAVDQVFHDRLETIRSSQDYRDAHSRLVPNALGQTSVVEFHDSIHLPVSGRSPDTVISRLLWNGGTERGRSPIGASSLAPTGERGKARRLLKKLWKAEQQRLENAATGSGKGQLRSSARKIQSFIEFLSCSPMQEIKKAWLDWRVARDAIRMSVFGQEQTLKTLQALYTGDRRVAVLVGGPPCQGFSRIGRGKIRSLREQSVHAQYDAHTGDRRNRLMHQYVMFVGALAPAVFLFENVRHFQAHVQTFDGQFSAPDILAEAIRHLSHDGLGYNVFSRIIQASYHLVPQKRERFFMVGTRKDMIPSNSPVEDLARWILHPPRRDEINLRTALEGLPAPHPLQRGRSNGNGLADLTKTSLDRREELHAEASYVNWIGQEPPDELADRSPNTTDAHHAREPRPDDQAFFALIGPGRRWMDYRCEESPTMGQLQGVLDALVEALDARQGRRVRKADPVFAALDRLELDQIAALQKAVDGSLSIRLLLEAIPPRPGEPGHHLLGRNYLAKREGSHGDWLARLDPDRPSKTMVSHMSKDTYAYVHPSQPRTLSVREAARIQSFPDWFQFGSVGLVDAFRMVGNAVPPLLSNHFADRVYQLLYLMEEAETNSGSRERSHMTKTMSAQE